MTSEGALSPDVERLWGDIEQLSSFRQAGSDGWTRRVFSPADAEARRWVRHQMEDAGLEVSLDAGANLIGLLPGSEGSSGGGAVNGALVTGSHTDTVEGGGRFDGIIGVLAAIEVARLFRESGVSLTRDLLVIDFLGEEPNDFGLSCLGSRAVAGTLGEEHLRATDPAGRTLAEALESAGGRPETIGDARFEEARVHCFLELHIEQGPVLEDAKVPIGVVSGIVGIERFAISLSGRPDHAGTTPMGRRSDALLGAAEIALAVERLAPGGVATTGRMEVRPGAQNVVPAEAVLWGEARSDEGPWLDGFADSVAAATAEVAGRRRLGSDLRWVSREPPVRTSGWLRGLEEEAAGRLGLDTLVVASGAGHDASQMAGLGPVGMIFVPSAGGRSHCPEEWTDAGQVAAGAAVLAETLRLADQGNPSGTGRDG